jgi:hypothetical protein
MAKGDKPVVKLYGKRKRDADQKLPEYVDVGAFWQEDGRLSGSWSRDIVAIKVKLRDGSEVVVKPQDYFCNLRDDREMIDAGELRREVQKRKAAAKPANDAPPSFDEAPPDFDDDDIPF